MSDLLGDLQRAMDLIAAQPYQPSQRLLSPRCGLHDEHAECRSAICQCECHLPAARAGARPTTTTGESQ